MIKKIAALVLLLALLTQRPHAQATAMIFFVDIGQGASTLIVSPTGKTLLVDGGPPGGGNKVGALLTTLGITTLDYTVLTHYHIDHDAGLIELLNAGKVAGIAFDNGDGPDVQPPGTSTSSTSTRGTYLNYVAATAHSGVTRQTIVAGQVIDLGGGMRVTALAAGGHLLSGGSVPITNDDLNSESVSLLVEYNDFDFIVSGDLTGGGSTSTAKTPDVETYVGQMAGDVDVIQLNHHGSTTTSNQIYLAAVKAEVAVAQTGTSNTFGHPNRETVNKYLNTPVSSGYAFAGTGIPPAGIGPVFYQHEDSPPTDDRVTHQGYTGASAANAGQGTILLQTDGTTTYSLSSFDDAGARLSPAAHTYPVDGVSAGLTSDFPPTVVVETTPVSPNGGESALVSAAVNDHESLVSGVVLNYAFNGVIQTPLSMTLNAGHYEATIPAQPDGTLVEFAVAGAAGGRTTTYASGYFSGVTPVASIRAVNSLGEPLYSGYAARIQGIVTAGSNTFSSGTNDDYVQDASGGINVFRSTDTPTPFTATLPGHVVQVVGRIGFNGGRQRLDITESLEKLTSPYGVTVLSTGPTPSPVSATIAALALNPESYEGQLVSIANCSIVGGSLPLTPQAVDAFVTVSDGTGTFSLKIDHDTDIEGFNPGSPFTVVGIVQQDDFLRPFDMGYDVAPRGRTDLGGSAAGATLISIAEARSDAINNADSTPGPDFIPDLLNQLVKIRGAVTSIDFRGGGGIEYYIQDPTGGIDLFSSSQNPGPFAIGDSVEAIGLVTHFNGLTEITVSSVTPLPPGTIPAATPQVVTLAQLADGGIGESLEGRLIRLNDVTITSGSFPAATVTGNVTITDSTGSAVLRIDSDTNIDGTPTPAGTFSVVGVLGQFDVTSPFDSGYQLFPRTLADIIVSGASAITATPSSIDFGGVMVGGSALASITITNVSLSTITLTPPFVLGGANANQFSVGVPATTTLAAGGATTVSVGFQPTLALPAVQSASLTIGSSDGSAVVALIGTAQSSGGTGSGSPIVISEFRFRGPSGGNDEFVEIYNNTDASIDISGWKINGSNNAGTVSTRATVPTSTTLPARRHYLFTNSGASGYSGSVPGNTTYGTGITDDGGVALLKPDNTIVDQVGLSGGSAYREGTTLPSLGAVNQNRSYERKVGGVNGSQQDTNDNAADFQLPPTSDPQNLASVPTPAIAVSPTSINLGSVVVGGTASAVLTIANLSPAISITLDALSLHGSNPASFIVGAPGTTTLAPNATTTVSIAFQPTSGGAHNAFLTIPTAANGSVNLTLTGTATGGITVNPAGIDFGTQSLGSLIGTTLTISTTDSATLTPPFAISGPNASEFFVGLPSTPTVTNGNDATVAVGFQPTTVGPKSASLLISSIDGGSRTVPLAGNVACPSISILGGLPNGLVGGPYSQSLIGNGGSDPYTFVISVGGLPPGLQLSAAGIVSGSPTTAGSYSVTIRATDANGCFAEASYTIGIVTATLTATPSPVSFGVVTAGTPASLPVTITNSSSFAVTLLPPFAISGAGASQFTAGSPSATALGPGASTDVSVTFSPGVAGATTATLTVASSNGGSTTLSLSGTGRQASISDAVVISEFRFRGAGGANDEFIEIFNKSDSPVDIGGYQLRGSNNAGTVTTRTTLPAGVLLLPAHAHYLFVNGAASAPVLAAADRTYGTGFTDDGGVAIAKSDGTTVDQVGLSSGSAFGEGLPLASLGGASVDHGYERKPGGPNGNGIDSNDNFSDFQMVTPTAPQNGASPITPALTVSPPTIDFGSTTRGTTADATVTITNNAGSSLVLTTPFALSGVNASDFAVGPPLVATLSGGASTTAVARFQPSSVGGKLATLTIVSAIGETHMVPLAGLSACPTISITASLPQVEAGVPYSRSFSANGGIEPYVFSVAGGSLPAGLSVSADGVLSGATTETGSFSFTVQATEDSGAEGSSCSATSTFALTVADTTPPAIICASPDAAWHGDNVSLACTAGDSGTGLANVVDGSFTLVTSVAADTENASAATNTRSVCDLSSNCATAGPIAGNKIDRKAPTVTISTPPNDAVYQVNQVVSAAFGCIDEGSGLTTCQGTVDNGSSIDTSTVGIKSFAVNSVDAVGHNATRTVSYEVRRTLTAVGPANVWIGLKNSDDAGLRVDLRAEVLVNGSIAASGELMNVNAGSSGFNNALLQSIAMSMTAGPVDIPPGGQLAMRVSARRTCSSNGHNSGTVREWFNGQPIDTGGSRDAGTRVGITLAGVSADYFLRTPFALSTASGAARQSVDVAVNGNAPCPSRPYVPFGTWMLSFP